MRHLHRTTIVLSLMLLVAGCAEQKKFMAPPEACPDANPGFITIVINYREDGDEKEILVPQNPQIVVEGDVIQFILRGGDNVLVSTSGKNAVSGWLNGSGRKNSRRPESGRFLVCVPRGIFDGEPADVVQKQYEYNVDAVRGNDEWPQLDPIVIVDRM